MDRCGAGTNSMTTRLTADTCCGQMWGRLKQDEYRMVNIGYLLWTGVELSQRERIQEG